MLGANGQLGKEFQFFNDEFDQFKLLFLDRKKCNVCDRDSINALKQFQPQVIINCAAYTAVDKAEEDQESAFQINAIGALFLAEFCELNSCLLIHFSSDYVYHSVDDRPLLETDPTTPQGIYAKSKLEGDINISKLNKKYLIFRTSWVYSSYGKNFVKTMLRLGESQQSLKIVSDQIGAPTYARDLAYQILNLIDRYKADLNTIPIGIYNISNSGQTNWSEFAATIFELSGLTVNITPIPTKEYPTPAQRPLWSVMNMDKLEAELSIKMPDWKKSLEKCLKEIVD